jgi:cation diffusion facilitator family transporter
MRHSDHQFQEETRNAENRTRLVMLLTGAMMVAEILAGTWFNSMALLADGWHMSTHLAAFLIAVIAYSMARRNRDNPRFSFGTGKIGVLGGFTSSIVLLMVAATMIGESVQRLFHPSEVEFGDALVVACVGLAVNVVSAFILHDHHHHDHAHGTAHSHAHDTDKNLKAAYLHVIADAFTSVTAIIALVCGLLFDIVWIDALMGMTGSLVIIWWAIGMIRDTVVVLVDYFPKTSDLEEEIRNAFSKLGDTTIADLHIWQVASGKFAAIISIETTHELPLEDYHRLVDMHDELVHVSIQVLAVPDVSN